MEAPRVSASCAAEDRPASSIAAPRTSDATTSSSVVNHIRCQSAHTSGTISAGQEKPSFTSRISGPEYRPESCRWLVHIRILIGGPSSFAQRALGAQRTLGRRHRAGGPLVDLHGLPQSPRQPLETGLEDPKVGVAGKGGYVSVKLWGR